MNNEVNITEDMELSEREQVKDAIKKEDKKNVKWFFILMAIGFVAGMVAAIVVIGIMEIEEGNFVKNIASNIVTMLKDMSIYVAWVASVISIPMLVTLYMQARKGFNAWDGEDEDQYKTIDNKLNIALFVTSMLTIVSYVFMPIGFSKMVSYADTDKQMVLISCGILIGGFLFMTAVTTIAQQKVINLGKEMNPEKQGSVFDAKFQKKWMDSCDEAEVKQVHEAAFASYKAVGTTIIILLFACMLASVTFDIGVLPMIIIGIIWLVQTIAYYVKAMQLNK